MQLKGNKKMIVKLFLTLFFFINLAWGDDSSTFAGDAVCTNRYERHFARNTRGCSWYWYCTEKNIAMSQSRCPVDYPRFNYDNQVCDYAENSECDFDKDVEYSCPDNAPIVNYVPHPFSCECYRLKIISI